MKIITTAEAFVAAMKNMRPEKKDTIPVLRYIKLSGNTLTATDLDVWTITQFAAKGKGEVLLPYKQTMDILQGEKGALEIEVIEPKKKKSNEPAPNSNVAPPVLLRINGCEFTLNGMSMTNFPQTPELVAPSLTLESKAFRIMLDRVRFAISNIESRYTLNGALLKQTRDEIHLIGTDGHRLSLATIPFDTGDFQAIIPTSVLDYIKTRLGDTFTIGIDDKNITIRTGDITVISRRLTGQFPNYEAVIPRDPKINVKVDGKFSSTLTRVAKCADERSLAVTFHFGGKSTVSAKSMDRGEATAPIPCISNGEITIGWNAQYVLDFLKVIGDGPFEIKMRDDQSAAMFSVDNFDYVCMPMRL